MTRARPLSYLFYKTQIIRYLSAVGNFEEFSTDSVRQILINTEMAMNDDKDEDEMNSNGQKVIQWLLYIYYIYRFFLIPPFRCLIINEIPSLNRKKKKYYTCYE